MRVRLHGFDLSLGAIDLDDFLLHLKSLKGNEHKFRGDYRLLYTGEHGHYHLGLLLSAKEQRRFCELTGSQGNFKVTVRELRKHNRFVDFNFFIVHKKTARGMFQHYRGSCGLSSFGFLLRKHYNDIRDLRKNAELQAADGKQDEDAIKKAIRAKYKDTLVCTPMYRQEDFEHILRQLTKIRSFSFDMTTLTKREAWLTPATNFIERERHTVTFSRDGGLKNIVNAISTAIKKDEVNEISVIGLDPTTEEFCTYRLFKNLDSFAQYEFDTIADNSTLNLENVEQSPFFQQMLDVASQNAVMFEKKAK